jgi:hypothetical protein
MYTLNLYREPRRFNVDMFLKLRALSKNYREDIFTPLLIDVKNRSKEYFRTIVHTCITSHLSSPVSIQVDKFDLNHWLNFGIVSISSVNAVLPLVCPLLLRRNLELALQIPVQWKFNLSKFQRAVVFRMDPALAREKTDVGVTMVPKNVLTFPPFYFHYFYHQSARMRNKIKSIVSLPVLTHLQEAWDYKPLYDKLFRTFSTRESIGLDVLIQTGIVDRNKWTAYVDEFTGRPDLREEEYEYFLKIVGIDYFLRTAEKLTPG